MTPSQHPDNTHNTAIHFSTLAAAIAYIEGYAARPEAERDTLPPRERQAARFPDMLRLLAELGNPQDSLRVAHVTGTSGKGSTATMLDAILRAAGSHTGLYTNPYITQPQERVQIDGAPIGDAEFIACAEAVAQAIAQLETRYPDWRPHLKQVWVALALLAFARAKVAYAVVEVGMGGRFDETNAVHPVVAIITTIGFDHMEFLGATLPEIAWHKAGIIKARVPTVTGVKQPERAVIAAEAAQVGAPLMVLGEDFTVNGIMTGPAGTTFSYQDEQLALPDAHSALVGAHQAHNAALAIRAARAIMPEIDAATLRAGLAQAWLPGRFEIVAAQPTVVLDAAHNPDKMAALVATLQATLTWERLWVVFGALGAKEIGPMLAALAPLQPLIIATIPQVAGRLSATTERLTEAASCLSLSATSAPDPAQAVELALRQASPRDVIVVTGSLFLVSQVRPHWKA